MNNSYFNPGQNYSSANSQSGTFPAHSTRIISGEAAVTKSAARPRDKRDDLEEELKSIRLPASPFTDTFFDGSLTTKPSTHVAATTAEDVKFEDAFLDSPRAPFDSSNEVSNADSFNENLDIDEATSMQWTRKRILTQNDSTILALMPETKSTSGTDERISLTKSMLAAAEVIAQVEAKFIIIKTQGKLCVVDQHAADERVALEKLENALFNPEAHDAMRIELTKKSLLVGDILKATSVMPAKRVSLTADQMGALRQHRGLLNKWHFTFKQPCAGDDTIHVTGVPSVCGRLTDVTDFVEFVDELTNSTGAQIKPECVKRILASQACRYAIMFGDRLTEAQCSKLISDLSKCDFSFVCAHGRPSVIPLVDLENNQKQRATTNTVVQNVREKRTTGHLKGPKRVIRQRVAFDLSVKK